MACSACLLFASGVKHCLGTEHVDVSLKLQIVLSSRSFTLTIDWHPWRAQDGKGKHALCHCRDTARLIFRLSSAAALQKASTLYGIG